MPHAYQRLLKSARTRNIIVVVPVNDPSAIKAIIPIPMRDAPESPSPINATVLIPILSASFPAIS